MQNIFFRANRRGGVKLFHEMTSYKNKITFGLIDTENRLHEKYFKKFLFNYVKYKFRFKSCSKA